MPAKARKNLGAALPVGYAGVRPPAGAAPRRSPRIVVQALAPGIEAQDLAAVHLAPPAGVGPACGKPKGPVIPETPPFRADPPGSRAAQGRFKAPTFSGVAPGVNPGPRRRRPVHAPARGQAALTGAAPPAASTWTRSGPACRSRPRLRQAERRGIPETPPFRADPPGSLAVPFAFRVWCAYGQKGQTLKANGTACVITSPPRSGG